MGMLSVQGVTLTDRLGSALVLCAMLVLWLIAVVIVTPYVAGVSLLSMVFPRLQLQPDQ